MYYKRHIDSYLEDWRLEKDHKPILLRGTRQIGKSTSVRKLGDKFDHFIEVNFEENNELKSIFEGNLDIVKITNRIEVVFNIPIIDNRTLIFFDEIQVCPNAIMALRYFYEKRPNLHVIATGSLLEFGLEELPSFGVGRIRSLYMYPFSFDEFLTALGEKRLLEVKKKASPNEPLDELFHNKLNEYLSIFLIIGGFPSAVKKYVESKRLLLVQDSLMDLSNSFQTDFVKYKKRVPSQRLLEVFRGVITQVGGKFVYNKIQELNNLQVKDCIELLIKAGLIIPVTHTSGNGIPIGAEQNLKMRKMHIIDTGLYQSMLGLQLDDIILDINNIINKGSLADLFWGLEYLKYQSPNIPPALYYWHRESSTSNAEVDYVIQEGNKIRPIEIKASNKGSMQSLRLFLNEKKINFGYRFSLENFSQYEDIKVMPLYAVSNLFAK
jgi:uncharacterized protein